MNLFLTTLLFCFALWVFSLTMNKKTWRKCILRRSGNRQSVSVSTVCPEYMSKSKMAFLIYMHDNNEKYIVQNVSDAYKLYALTVLTLITVALIIIFPFFLSFFFLINFVTYGFISLMLLWPWITARSRSVLPKYC